MSTYIIDLISHLTLRKIGLTRIKTLSPPMWPPRVKSGGGGHGPLAPPRGGPHDCMCMCALRAPQSALEYWVERERHEHAEHEPRWRVPAAVALVAASVGRSGRGLTVLGAVDLERAEEVVGVLIAPFVGSACRRAAATPASTPQVRRYCWETMRRADTRPSRRWRSGSTCISPVCNARALSFVLCIVSSRTNALLSAQQCRTLLVRVHYTLYCTYLCISQLSAAAWDTLICRRCQTVNHTSTHPNDSQLHKHSHAHAEHFDALTHTLFLVVQYILQAFRSSVYLHINWLPIFHIRSLAPPRRNNKCTHMWNGGCGTVPKN